MILQKMQEPDIVVMMKSKVCEGVGDGVCVVRKFGE